MVKTTSLKLNTKQASVNLIYSNPECTMKSC